MMGSGGGMGVGDWIPMTLFWVGLLILIVWLFSESFSPGRRERGADGAWQEAPEQVLDRFYASGEIDGRPITACALRCGRRARRPRSRSGVCDDTDTGGWQEASSALQQAHDELTEFTTTSEADLYGAR